MTLPAPPRDPAELADFPFRQVPADFPYARIHHDRFEPEWFCQCGQCRFDPPAGGSFGTCYLAGHPLGAFVEKFGRLRVVPRSLVDQHSLTALQLPSPLRVADVTDRRILSRWHLSAELRRHRPCACPKPASPPCTASSGTPGGAGPGLSTS